MKLRKASSGLDPLPVIDFGLPTEVLAREVVRLQYRQGRLQPNLACWVSERIVRRGGVNDGQKTSVGTGGASDVHFDPRGSRARRLRGLPTAAAGRARHGASPALYLDVGLSNSISEAAATVRRFPRPRWDGGGGALTDLELRDELMGEDGTYLEAVVSESLPLRPVIDAASVRWPATQDRRLGPARRHPRRPGDRRRPAALGPLPLASPVPPRALHRRSRPALLLAALRRRHPPLHRRRPGPGRDGRGDPNRRLRRRSRTRATRPRTRGHLRDHDGSPTWNAVTCATHSAKAALRIKQKGSSPPLRRPASTAASS